MPGLAPYAALEQNSHGRRHVEPGPNYRSEFQRDRDRIVHSAAFRRLEYKTQVFVNHEGDMFRTRLTHSLEVAQIARSIARILNLNEDLAETIALAHDLGHTPFGHAGQDALNRCMNEYGGFEHNLQSLRTVDELEKRYADFDGLNLTFESREGILKHCSPIKARELGDVGRRFIEHGQPSLEAQIVNLADEIAYNNHDVDDGLRAGLITLEQLGTLELFRMHRDDVLAKHPGLEGRPLIHETTRRMINALVVDLVDATRANLESIKPDDIVVIRSQSDPLAQFSEAMKEKNLELKRFLRKELYRHYRVHRMSVKADKIITAMFGIFMDDIRLMPPEQHSLARIAEQGEGRAGVARIIADYVAGMTDRYAISEYKRLFEPGELT